MAGPSDVRGREPSGFQAALARFDSEVGRRETPASVLGRDRRADPSRPRGSRPLGIRTVHVVIDVSMLVEIIVADDDRPGRVVSETSWKATTCTGLTG